MKLSQNTIQRGCQIYGFLDYLQKHGIRFVSSGELAKKVGATDYSIRKDLSSLNITGFNRKGYDVQRLKEKLGAKLNLTRSYKACVVGLGKLGTALLDYKTFKQEGFDIIAAFDSSINKIERIQTDIDVFPVSQLEEVVKQRQIDLGIITVPLTAAQDIADKLIMGGIKGIVNFSPINIIVPSHVVARHMDFTDAFRFVAARLNNQS